MFLKQNKNIGHQNPEFWSVWVVYKSILKLIWVWLDRTKIEFGPNLRRPTKSMLPTVFIVFTVFWENQNFPISWTVSILYTWRYGWLVAHQISATKLKIDGYKIKKCVEDTATNHTSLTVLLICMLAFFFKFSKEQTQQCGSGSALFRIMRGLWDPEPGG